MESKQSRPRETTQRDRFIETARVLGCDEDEGRFNEMLKWIAPKEPKERAAEES